MTVVANGDGSVSAHIGDAMRAIVLNALDVEEGSARKALTETASANERAELCRRLQLAIDLREELKRTVGATQLHGPQDFIIDIIRDAAAKATDSLDSFVEPLSHQSERLPDDTIAELRRRRDVAIGCIESLIACEGSRSN